MRFPGCKIWTFAALLLLACLSSTAQRFDWRTRIDELVELADSMALKYQHTFFLTKYIGIDQPYKETWYYTVRDGKVLEFEIRYVMDSIEHSETYYLDNGSPVCMERYETIYFGFREDEIKRGEVVFLEHEAVRQYVSIGHRNDDDFSFNGQSFDSMRRFSNRYSELKKNIVATGQRAIERFP